MKKLAALDVDGVVLKGQFLLSFARLIGPLHCLYSLVLCLLYEIGVLSLTKLIRKVFAAGRGRRAELLDEAYSKLKIRPGIAETVERLKSEGYEVVLLSSGVPQEIIDRLSSELGIRWGRGVVLPRDAGYLTGEVQGETLEEDGKLRMVEALLHEHSLLWDDVLVIGDDRSNIPLFREAGLSIGLNPTSSLRRFSDYELSDDDLPDVFNRPPRSYIPRKLIHLSGLLFIPLWQSSKEISAGILLIATLFYLVSESVRLRGKNLPLISYITRLCLRGGERKRMALAPVALSLGVLLSLLIFPPGLSHAMVISACLGDSVAMLAGRAFGRIPLLYNPPKTLEGTIAHFLSTTLGCYLIIGEPFFLFCAISAVIESLPLRELENFAVPIVSGLLYLLIT